MPFTMLSMVHLQFFSYLAHASAMKVGDQNSPIRSPLKESHGSFMDGEIDAFQVLLLILFHQPRIILQYFINVLVCVRSYWRLVGKLQN